MRNLTFTDVERFDSIDEETEALLHMDDEAFRVFYDRTARPVWSYLLRVTGSRQLADDLLQETYYRFLRMDRAYASDAHRRNYLFRIATNLVKDGRRRPKLEVPCVDEDLHGGGEAFAAASDEATRAVERADLSRAMARLKPRERALLWLAYAHGSSHVEIAETLGLRTTSIKSLLFRARRKMADLLRGGAS